MKKKKILTMFLIISIIMLIPKIGFAQIDDQVLRLAQIDIERDSALSSIAEQLEAQDMLIHYEIYESIINQQYELAKQMILNDRTEGGEETYLPLSSGIYFPYGGEVKYSVPGYYTSAIQYISPYHTSQIIDQYLQSSLTTMGDVAWYHFVWIAGFLHVALTVVLGIIGSVAIIGNYLTSQTITNIQNSTGASQIIAIETAYGESVVWTTWYSYSQITVIPEDAINVQIIAY